MWSQAGGHASPPASTVLETLPARNSLQTPFPLHLSSSCVVTIFTWAPAYTLMQYQPDAIEPLEFRRAQGVYPRMYRSVDPPYRRQSFDERLQSFRQIMTSNLDSEDESTEQIYNIASQDSPPRYVIKRHVRNHSFIRQDMSIYIDSTRNNTEDHEMIQSDRWARHESQYTEWQADEPELSISPHAPLQIDDSEPNYEPGSYLGRLSATTPSMFMPLYNPFLYQYPAHSFHTYTGGIYDPIPATISDYESSNNGYSSNNESEDMSIDRPMPMRPEPQRPVEVIDLTSDETEDVSSSSNSVSNGDNNNMVIDLVSESSDQSDNEEDSIPVMKLYARPAPMPNLPASTVASRQAANSVIKHARNNRTINEKALHCLNCDLIPYLPVTGKCGHTRCIKCIKRNGSCPCGTEAPRRLHVNTVIQYLIGKMLPNDYKKRGHPTSVRRSQLSDDTMAGSSAGRKGFKGHSSAKGYSSAKGNSRAKRMYSCGRSGIALLTIKARTAMAELNVRMPLAPQVQYEHARQLLSRRQFRDAAPHFARVAASDDPLAHTARSLLSQIIVVIAEGRDPRRITRDLFKAVRLQSVASWLRASDLECGLCYHAYTKPVTTPCGHTYCRSCLEKAMDYRKVCSLCMRPLDDLNLTRTRETVFVGAALEAVGVVRPTMRADPNVIPIFVCTVAYPSIPCPLFIFDPRYWLMIRRVLESGTRRFGMIAYERDCNYSEYGTVLQVCDCVQLEDGRSFLSTVGVSRFKVLEHDVMDGCDVARVQQLIDVLPSEPVVNFDIRVLAYRIYYKSLAWLNGMDPQVRCEIESAFGEIPGFEPLYFNWWHSPDGPAWLWWLVAILPLRTEIKVLILSTKSLLKRILAVCRTLEAVDQASITTTTGNDCEMIRSAISNAEDWVERES